MLRYAAVVLALLTGNAWAAPVSDATELFCLDSTGVHQPFNRTDVGRLRSAFTKYMELKPSVGTDSTFVFSDGSQTVTYKVEPHDSGVSLLSMEVRLDGVKEDVAGNDMCWKTFNIVNNTVN